MTGLRPKLVIGITSVVVLLILLSLAQEMNRRWQVQREVQQLDAEVQDLQKNVIELEHLNQYFRTDDYQERLAREKLNYRSQDEQVVLIPEEDLPDERSLPKPTDEDERDPIPLRWWKLLFVDPILEQ